MFEAERILSAETPFIPVYTYVTKRMVNPRLKGWQSNVMDHHYSKDMYFLRAASDEPAVDVKPEEKNPASDTVEDVTVPGEKSESVESEENLLPAEPATGAETPAAGDVATPAEDIDPGPVTGESAG